MTGVVTTVGEKCKRCYTCVRSCPAKAIRVQEGQAKVLPERCVGCGNCIRVCAQGAKRVESEALAVTKAMISEGEHVIACLAPSFPVAFREAQPRQVVSAARALGFSEVMEVAVGAELVARAYERLLRNGNSSRPTIATPCPALVSYVEKYLPELIPMMAPIVSPMIALGRLLKQALRPRGKVVFVGPCVAKKAEARDPNLAGAVDAVLTFEEFTDWLEEAEVDILRLAGSDFDGPHPGVGRIFPVSGGLLRTASIAADVLDNEIVVTEGVDRTTELLWCLANGETEARFFDLLFCEGCIKGPFAGSTGNAVALKQVVASYAADELRRGGAGGLADHPDLDLSRGFSDMLVEAPLPSEEELRAILRQTNKQKPEDELNCGACGYPTCRDNAIAVYRGLAEAEMCLPYIIDRLEHTVHELDISRRDLVSAHEQLVHSEKLASMGQLAAGVAHEINNPLGTVLIYAHMLLRDLPAADPRRSDVLVISEEADRCRRIVSGLLNFARQSKLREEPTDVNGLLRDTLSVVQKQEAFADLRVVTDLSSDLPIVRLDPEQMRQAFIDILENAAEAMPEGGVLTVSTHPSADGQSVCFVCSDTGCGIPEENLERIFHPFFTTKQIGKGTGLGLAIVYGIVKMHRGSISVDSRPGEGARFTIALPLVRAPETEEAVLR